MGTKVLVQSVQCCVNGRVDVVSRSDLMHVASLHAVDENGAVTIGDALRTAVLVERIAQIYVQAELAGGATALPDDAVEAERAAYLMRHGFKAGSS